MKMILPRTCAILPLTLTTASWSADKVVVDGQTISIQPTSPSTVQLLDSKAYMPPPVKPDTTFKAFSPKGLLKSIAEAGPWYNKASVYGNLTKAWVASAKKGLAEAERFGQKGLLLKVEVLQEPIPAGGGTFYSLRDSGVAYLGVGPDANSVCIRMRCELSLSPSIKPIQSYAEGSGYYWVTEGSRWRINAERYDIGQLEDRSRLVTINKQLQNDIVTLTYSRALTDLTDRLREIATMRQDRQRIDDYATERTKALAEMELIEMELSKQLRRAKRAAESSRTLNTITSAFSLGSAIAMINASTGEDVSKAVPGEIRSPQDIQTGLSNIKSDADARVQNLKKRRNAAKAKSTAAETSLIEISVEYRLDPASIPVLRKPLESSTVP